MAIESSRGRGIEVAKRREVALYVDNMIVERVKHDLVTEQGAWSRGRVTERCAGMADTTDTYNILGNKPSLCCNGFTIC